MAASVSTGSSVPQPGGPVRPGYLQVFADHPMRDEVLAATERAFFESIERLAGPECRERVEAEGLAALHKHFPRTSLGELEFLVVEQVRPLWLRWAARVGREAVGWQDEFYVQGLVLARINYPHTAEALPSLGPLPIGLRLKCLLLPAIEKLRYARFPRKLWRRLPELLSFVRAKRSVPEGPFRCHPLHTDSWFGQPVDSLSLWFGIAGVSPETAMTLYPETTEMWKPQNELLYFGSGFQLPPPTRPEHGDGDLLAFSTDMLHCSQLNVSDQTRIALTVRISPGEPRFDEDNFWYVSTSLKASDLIENRATTPARNGARAEAMTWRREGWPYSTPTVQLSKRFSGERMAVARTEQLPEGGKLALVFPNREVVLFRTPAGVRAYRGQCPHQGYRLADGMHDAGYVTCPGHGQQFDLETGQSKLECFKLESFPVSEEDGTIFLGSVPS